jgi:predicted nucleic acid-binding protein
VTGSRVAFDTWAWWEVLQGSEIGVKLATKYLPEENSRVFTSAISLGELSAKLSLQGSSLSIPVMAASVQRRSEVVDVTSDLALEAGQVRTALRRVHPSASLADALVLLTARRSGAKLISIDPAFKKEPDVFPS